MDLALAPNIVGRNVLSTGLDVLGRLNRVRHNGAEGLPNRSELVQLERAAASEPLRLPAFDGKYLPAGIHDASLGEFALRFGSQDAGGSRSLLMAHGWEAMRALMGEHVDHVIVGGSFVTTKARPNDLDALVTGSNLAETGWWYKGIHIYHADESGDASSARFWRGKPDPTLLEFFQHARSGREVGVVRVHLPMDDAATRAEARQRVDWFFEHDTPDRLAGWISRQSNSMRPHVEREVAARLARGPSA